jgi:hypothetical protein
MFSADGYVTLTVKWDKKKKIWRIIRRIKLACKHPILKEQISELLKKVGLLHQVSKEELIIERKRDILKFAEEIKFVPGVKVTKNSKFWRGLEKNDVLNLVIKSFEINAKDLKRFKTKEEVINFLKSLVGSGS